MGPQNGVMGNDALPTELPQTPVDDSQIRELEKTAKFAKSKEYKELKEHFDRRIKFYQAYLPNGAPVGSNASSNDGKQLSMEEIGQRWVAANVIIGELQAILGVYDNAEQDLKDYKSGLAERTRA